MNAEISQDYLTEIPSNLERYIILDVETTGLSLFDHIISLGAYAVENCKISNKIFNFCIQPRVKIKPNAKKINHFNEKYFKTLPRIDEKKKLTELFAWIGDSLIFCHNAPFDRQFLNRELSFHSIPMIPDTQFRCTQRLFLKIVRKTNPAFIESSTTLQKCCEYFGLFYHKSSFHISITDARITGDLLKILLIKINKNNLKNDNGKKSNKIMKNNDQNNIKYKGDVKTGLFKDLEIDL